MSEEPILKPDFLNDSIAILPQELEGESLRAFIPFVLKQLDNPLYIFVDGDGGTCSEAQALVDLFQWHGNVTGILLGSAMSAHVTVWAGCTTRIAFPGSYIGIHKVGSYGEMSMDSHVARYTLEDYERIERQICDLFGSISNHTSKWWYREMQKTGRNSFKTITAKELITKYEMARPNTELDRAWLTKVMQSTKSSNLLKLKASSTSPSEVINQHK